MWLVGIDEAQMDCFQTLKVKQCAFFLLILSIFEKVKAVFKSTPPWCFLFIHLVRNLLVTCTFYKCQYTKTTQLWGDSITKHIKRATYLLPLTNQSFNFYFHQTWVDIHLIIKDFNGQFSSQNNLESGNSDG